MNCPYCNHEETKVLETRDSEQDITRRRRECLKCEKRFTTYEQVEYSEITLIKKNGKKTTFDKQKVINSIKIACRKRPVTEDKIKEIATKIENKLRNNIKKEVSSKQVGEMVLKHLKKLDQVAYIRFASVYRDFQDLETFKKELDNLEKE